jgi:mRNA-degrading endonuclease RelE of RelBE toxin-antitoxin system
MAKTVIHRRASRYIERIDARFKDQPQKKLADLARDPQKMPGIKPMAGEWAGFHRLRHANLRVIYFHDGAADTVVIAHVAPRGDVYR